MTLRKARHTCATYAGGIAVAAALALPGLAALAPLQGPPPVVQPSRLAVLDAVVDLGPAQAVDEPYCTGAAEMAASLQGDFGETRLQSQDRADSTRLDLWAAQEMGTWTLVYIRRDGVACVLDSGTGDHDFGDNATQARLIAQGTDAA